MPARSFKHSIPRFCLIALALAFTCHALCCRAAEDLKATLEAIRLKHQLPSLAAIVFRDGHVVGAGATGVRKLGAPAQVTLQDKFHLGSCTKAVTATLAGRLVDEGKISWSTRIVDVFPEFKGHIDAQYENVTLEQLMGHRGGFPTKPDAAAWTEAWRKKGPPQEQRYRFIKQIMALPPEAPPGARFIYSNQGFAVAGAMLEKVAKVPWEALLKTRLFDPLGMYSAGFGIPGTSGGTDQPWGHHNEGGQIKPIQSDNPPAIGPAGTMHCSLPDLAKYGIAHLKGDHGEGTLLKPATFKKIHSGLPGQEYGFGWGHGERSWAGGKTLMHNGSNTMNFMVIWLAPNKDFGVIVATNFGDAPAPKALDETASTLIKKFL